MRYCLTYNRSDSRYIFDVEEITINFNPADASLPDFLLLHSHQRMNIYIPDFQDFIDNNRIKLFAAIVEKHPDLEIVFKLYAGDGLCADVSKTLRENNFRYFFTTFARDWDIFHGLLSLKPSDIYVTDSLGFCLKQCAKIAHKEDINIRVFPNVAQSTWKDTPPIKKFFIRPEDVEKYEPYVDTFEFFSSKSNKEPVFYRIYEEDRKWAGNLNELIISLHLDIDSRTIGQMFGEKRTSCMKRCLSGSGCNICNRFLNLSNLLTENELVLTDLSQKHKKIEQKHKEQSLLEFN